MCVCDINKETPRLVRDLNDASVNVVHVPAICKNAADEKLRQAMRRFVDNHCHYAEAEAHKPMVVLISRDTDFAPDLSDFRHRKGAKIVVVCSLPVPQQLLVTAHAYYAFLDFVADVPYDNIEVSSLVSPHYFLKF